MVENQNQNQASRGHSGSSTPDDSIVVVLNGEECRVRSMTDVAALLRARGIDPERPGIAVALNDQIVRRADWTRQIVAEGDRLEVITALQGG